MDDRTVAIILAGGQGSRLRELYPDTPKPLIPVAGEPFVEWIIRHLASQGIRRFVVSLGHLAQLAERHFANRRADGLSIRTVREDQPLGTGGGFHWAQQQAAPTADPLLVVNGDSLVLADFSQAWRQLNHPSVDGVVLGVEMDAADRYGRIEVDAHGRLIDFQEKRPGSGRINAGVYFLRRRLLQNFPAARPLSFELDLFPRWLAADAHIAVTACRAPFIDIGIPDTVRQAESFIDRHFHRMVPS